MQESSEVSILCLEQNITRCNLYSHDGFLHEECHMTYILLGGINDHCHITV